MATDAKYDQAIANKTAADIACNTAKAALAAIDQSITAKQAELTQLQAARTVAAATLTTCQTTCASMDGAAKTETVRVAAL
jgi:hypothetical protein